MNFRVRPLLEEDEPEADRVLRLAFGTLLGLADPAAFLGDADYVRGRRRANPEGAFIAEKDGRIVGSNFATRWGTFGFFGPLTVDPAAQDQGCGSALMEPVLDLFGSWGTTHAGLFTSPTSPRHLGLYQKFGFRPRALTLIMEKQVSGSRRSQDGWTTYQRLSERARVEALAECRAITDRIYPGLDATPEVLSIHAGSLGDTLLPPTRPLTGFATCHTGPGSEAGSGVSYVKFGAVAPQEGAGAGFRRLLAACETYAAGAGARRIIAGVNAARTEAYETMLAAGFRIFSTGVAMHRPNAPGFSRPDAFVIDDWR